MFATTVLSTLSHMLQHVRIRSLRIALRTVKDELLHYISDCTMELCHVLSGVALEALPTFPP
jgi:hypothetical protein